MPECCVFLRNAAPKRFHARQCTGSTLIHLMFFYSTSYLDLGPSEGENLWYKNKLYEPQILLPDDHPG
jgi:hypothetical protein